MISNILAALKRHQKWVVGLSLTALLAVLLLSVFFQEWSSAQASPSLTTGGSYKVSYRVTDQWDDGYSVAIKITNTTKTPVKNWSIGWQLTHNEKRLADSWAARCALLNGRTTCNNLNANATIGSNGSVEFGTDFYGNGQITNPTTFSVNGVLVSTGLPEVTTPAATATSVPVKPPVPATPTPVLVKPPVKPVPSPTPVPAQPTSTPLPAQPTSTPVPAQPTSTPVPAQPTSTPTVSAPTTGNWWKPTPDQPIAWHWQLSDTFVFPRDVLPNVKVYDIDGETTSADTVAKLHALSPDIKVICYFDAGVYETYRSDASRFPQSVIGQADTGWSGSYWLDIRQTDILLPILKDRMQHWCKDKGFDAIEPDETEVWSNNSGFAITKDQNNFYNQKVAELAHSLGLSAGLKGNTTEAPELWTYFDWTLNEQCWQYKECDALKSSFIDHGKAVFNIEYNVNPDCTTANSWKMNSARRDLNLVGPTSKGYSYSPCVPNLTSAW